MRERERERSRFRQQETDSDIQAERQTEKVSREIVCMCVFFKERNRDKTSYLVLHFTLIELEKLLALRASDTAKLMSISDLLKCHLLLEQNLSC